MDSFGQGQYMYYNKHQSIHLFLSNMTVGTLAWVLFANKLFISTNKGNQAKKISLWCSPIFTVMYVIEFEKNQCYSLKHKIPWILDIYICIYKDILLCTLQ